MDIVNIFSAYINTSQLSIAFKTSKLIIPYLYILIYYIFTHNTLSAPQDKKIIEKIELDNQVFFFGTVLNSTLGNLEFKMFLKIVTFRIT